MTILTPSSKKVKKLSAIVSLGLVLGVPLLSIPAFSRPDKSIDYDYYDRDEKVEYQRDRSDKANYKQSPIYSNSDRYDYSKYRRRASQNVLAMPKNVERKLLSIIAEKDDININRLQVISSKPKTFNGCLGIYKPDTACTEIAIQGWQAIVSNGQNTWVYHLDRDGSKIVKNNTASGAKQSIYVSFQPKDEVGSNAIFRSVVSGGLTANRGTVTTYTLTRDGKIIQSVTGPLVRSMPVVVKTISPQAVRQFEQLLAQQRFPNLNGFTYTNKSVADVPTTSLESMGARVDYVDPDLKSLPNSLRRVSAVWNRLLDKAS